MLRRLSIALAHIGRNICYCLPLGKSQRRLVGVILVFVLAFLLLFKGVLDSLESLGYDRSALCGKRKTVTPDLGGNGIIDIWSRNSTQQTAGYKEKNVFLTVRHFIKLNVGRVQTPTLAILLDRKNAIAGFQKEKYYTVKLKADGLDAVSEKATDESEAKRIAGECSGKSAVVKSVKTERKTVNPPKLYDLTTLQRDANRLYGYTAQQTLDYVQSLYEMKLCT